MLNLQFHGLNLKHVKYRPSLRTEVRIQNHTNESDVWSDDLLGYEKIGAAFTNIVKSVSDSKVISIEAPFGHGMTFFRQRWARELKKSGEMVIEIDAQQSDHSGDPLITFMGALLSEKLRNGEPLSATLKEKALKLGGILGRSTLRVLLRNGAEEVIEAGADWI